MLNKIIHFSLQNRILAVSYTHLMHNWLYDKFVASKTVTGETDPRMFGSFVFNDNVSEIIRPKGRCV